IMMLLDRRRVALFTAEGAPAREGGRIALGPLALETGNGTVTLRFRGPAVIVPDGAAYLSIERALAAGALDEAVDVSVHLELDGPVGDLNDALTAGAPIAKRSERLGSFGRLSGTIRVDGTRRELDAVGRAGLSFTGIGAARFGWRRMLWACFPGNAAHSAIEVRLVANEQGIAHRSGRILRGSRWSDCEVAQLDLDTPAVDAPPLSIAATLGVEGTTHAIVGEVRSFIPLSRPGPDRSRIYTSLGFANFRIGASLGAGMFEYSRRAALEPIADDSAPGEDS
ncbi:MAG: hypothetical protein WA005_00970, partial [Candidatus Binataceae bacterium]